MVAELLVAWDGTAELLHEGGQVHTVVPVRLSCEKGRFRMRKEGKNEDEYMLVALGTTRCLKGTLGVKSIGKKRRRKREKVK